MNKPCAVFWDIENINVPKGQTVNSVIELIRSTIIKPHNLNEIFFYCVCDVHKLPLNIGSSLTSLNIDIVQAYNGVKDSADIKIMDLMKKFVKFAEQDCTIILISGDGDYYGSLNDLKKLYNVSIHLIRLANSFSPKLDEISDYTFMLNNGTLKPVKSTGSPNYFISISNYSLAMGINSVMKGFNTQAIGSIQNSAILYGNSICIGFPTLWFASKVIEQLNGSRFYGKPLKVELIVDSPLTEIFKCLKPNTTLQPKSNKEVQQLTFIEINNTYEAVDNRKIIKFCISCATQSGSQCILSRKSLLWIVFSFKSDAQKFLPKIQILFPDAIISESPIDLTLAYLDNPYNVEPCEHIVSDKKSPDSGVDNSNIVMQTKAKYQNISITRAAGPFHSADIETKETKLVTTRTESQNNNLKIFFRCDHSFANLMLYCKPTRWSLLYNLFEQLYDLGAKKVIFDGIHCCAHFDSASAYQDAFEKRHSHFLGHLKYLNVSEAHKQKVTKIMDRYITGIPWCLNRELDLCCLVVKTEPQLHHCYIEMSKNILGNRECIFIKSVSGEIWIGFPDELTCKNSKKTVFGLLANIKQPTDILMAKPSNELLQSIDLLNLVGDAYDLAFLSKSLDGLVPFTKPKTIERMNFQRMEERNESLFHFTVKGDFFNLMPWVELSPKQIVKIFVKFSKVIPIAATASYFSVNLIYNSWYEAHVARHFINNLTPADVPYFKEVHKASEVKQQFTCYNFLEYFVINDRRKVLEKIMRKNNLANRLDSDPSTVQSTSDIDASDRRLMKKLQYFFVISTNSGFKFTSGMISIIKMNLVQMDCPICIEFEDKIWVAVDDLGVGNKVKTRFRYLNFKMLHENDEDDFDVEIVMQLVSNIPTIVSKIWTNKLINPKTRQAADIQLIPDGPLGHFNYNYRKAVGMSISRYCQANSIKSVPY